LEKTEGERGGPSTKFHWSAMGIGQGLGTLSYKDSSSRLEDDSLSILLYTWSVLTNSMHMLL